MYARLRGVPPGVIEGTVGHLLQRIDLAEYADRCAAQLAPQLRSFRA